MDSVTSSLSSYYHIIFTSLAFILSGLIILLTRKTKSKALRLPPGPPGWPVVGNLFQVVRSGKPFFEYVAEVRSKYGPIFTLKMGARTMIVVSNAELTHEALVEKGQVFANRPRENPTRAVYSCNKFTVNSALYGPVWRSLRRNMVQGMLSSARLKEFHNVRSMAMDKLIDRLRAEAQSNNGVVRVLKNARFAVFCILLSMCFGVDMDENTIEMMDRLMKKVLTVLDPRIDDYLPILSPFFAKQHEQLNASIYHNINAKKLNCSKDSQLNNKPHKLHQFWKKTKIVSMSEVFASPTHNLWVTTPNQNDNLSSLFLKNKEYFLFPLKEHLGRLFLLF
ncbi:Cytochrome P450 [Dillenia turbinata]|uniref:Cytochrome P450 n=1 Tax=Dillenia turbinata TaxID=194707 RepID=A0AAN8V7Q8_9MAGN